jgi:hypothetical protein
MYDVYDRSDARFGLGRSEEKILSVDVLIYPT